MSVKISIITVNYNNEKGLEKTIKSVIFQSYGNIEYIIIDGNSKDNSIKIIDKYANKIDKIISEQDNGVYDAMNKGIEISTGDWIIFMNSGDIFYDQNSIASIFKKTIESDVLFGNAIYTKEKKQILVKTKNLNRMNFYMPFSHQSVFVKSKILKKFGFDTSFSILADFNLFHRLHFKNYKFRFVEAVVCICDANSGISKNQKNAKKIKKERIRIIGHFNNFIYFNLWKKLKKLIRNEKI